ncbi:MAG: TolC family outer membrane protein [Thiotrichales bacterium]|nr:TolC family outer membrane protein [Thiotrichales bacterium]
MKKVPVHILCLLGAIGLTFNAHADDLEKILSLALENDPQINQTKAAYAAALESRPQARANFLPNISFSVNTTDNAQDRQFGAGSIFSGNEDFNSHGYTLSLTQPVYNRDSIVQRRQTDAIVGEAKANLSSSEQSLVIRVAERYFDILAAEDNVTFAKTEKKAIARQLKQTNERFEVGLIPITDVNEAQASYDLSIADEIDADNTLLNAREGLREITSNYHEILAPLIANTPLISPDPENIERWVEVALNENLSVIAAEFASTNLRHAIDRAKSGLYPTVDIVASRSNNVSAGGSLGGSEIDSTALGLELNVPLYAGGRIFSQARQAQARLEESNQLLEQQRRSVVRQVRESYLGVLASISRVEALVQAEKSSQSALEANEVGLEVGTRTTVDVLNARRVLFGAKRDLARARYDYILNTLRLKQAAGTLTNNDIREVNRWLAR